VISYCQGDLLEADVDALVNAVNTVGVMGKGIALAFKTRFPANYQAYAAACQRGEVVTGRMFVTETPALLGPRWIVNFPTKQHWRDPSRLEWVQTGLQDLRRFLLTQDVKSVALPALGAGLGGLSWPVVRAEIEAALGDLDTMVLAYEPQDSQRPTGRKV
jgi:O-acetyl-ADP-ribose deacetylase (regulator of RNase III)